MSPGTESGDGDLRIGVYVCHCGNNIAKMVDVAAVARRLGEERDVVLSKHYRFMCSDPGQELIQADIRAHGLNRIVVAACSPLMHEPTFRAACQDAGLNRYYFEMANIREQVSWVVTDREAATRKATAVLRGAVARVRHHEALEPRKVSITRRVMVVGGGIAGIEAALQIADAGFEVVLVEREPSIGGHMSQFDKTFPTLDCAACILTPKMVAVNKHPNIRLMTWSEVDAVDGYVGNFKVTVRRKARSVDTATCNSCGDCYEACPARPLPARRRLVLGDQVVREGEALSIADRSRLAQLGDLTVLTAAQPKPEPAIRPEEVPA